MFDKKGEINILEDISHSRSAVGYRGGEMAFAVMGMVHL
jgi:hypothetical protein